MLDSKISKVLGYDPKTSFNKLYVLCDYETLLQKNYTLEKFISKLSSYDTKLLQFRDKISSFKTKQKSLEYLKDNLNIPIIINDELDLAYIVDGIHLGQEDFSKISKDKKEALDIIRNRIGNDKLIGLSTHNIKEIEEANRLNIDMIGLGAYKNTSTKDVSSILGENLSILAKSSKHPVCAIGGVKVFDKIDNVSFNVVGSGIYD